MKQQTTWKMSKSKGGYLVHVKKAKYLWKLWTTDASLAKAEVARLNADFPETIVARATIKPDFADKQLEAK